MFPRKQRISRAESDVFLKGRALHGERFSIRFIQIGGTVAKFTVVISGKKTNAVERNFLKRRTRAALVRIAGTVRLGAAVVVYTRPFMRDVSVGQIQNELRELFIKAGLIAAVENSRVKA